MERHTTIRWEKACRLTRGNRNPNAKLRFPNAHRKQLRQRSHVSEMSQKVADAVGDTGSLQVHTLHTVNSDPRPTRWMRWRLARLTKRAPEELDRSETDRASNLPPPQGSRGPQMAGTPATTIPIDREPIGTAGHHPHEDQRPHVAEMMTPTEGTAKTRF